MAFSHTAAGSRRRAFTRVELLVVIVWLINGKIFTYEEPPPLALSTRSWNLVIYSPLLLGAPVGHADLLTPAPGAG